VAHGATAAQPPPPPARRGRGALFWAFIASVVLLVGGGVGFVTSAARLGTSEVVVTSVVPLGRQSVVELESAWAQTMRVSVDRGRCSEDPSAGTSTFVFLCPGSVAPDDSIYVGYTTVEGRNDVVVVSWMSTVRAAIPMGIAFLAGGAGALGALIFGGLYLTNRPLRHAEPAPYVPVAPPTMLAPLPPYGAEQQPYGAPGHHHR
jgi:hypothetical protein